MKYDLIIIGAGPAGLSAGIYSARYNLKTLVIGKVIGGLAVTAHRVCNFPSYTEIPGYELMRKIKKQVNELGVMILNDNVDSIDKIEGGFFVKTDLGKKYFGKTILLALGTEREKLGVKNEGKYAGRGVSYCASCDAGFYKNKIVAVVGGGNAALTSALLLSDIAKRVYLIYRGDKFVKAEQTWVSLVDKNKKIEILFKEKVKELVGKENVSGVILDSGKRLIVDGVFVETGSVPDSGLAKKIGIKLDEKSYIKVDNHGRTNVEGVFAAGDVTNNNLKQIVTACAEGATAAYSVYQDLIMGK